MKDHDTLFPIIDTHGSHYERGAQYGRQARDQVRLSIEGYAKVFQHYAKWEWSQVIAHARTFLPAIDDFASEYMEEMRGIADGARVDLLDILSINLRTEVMFAAKAQTAAATLPRIGECTSFAALGSDGSVLAGQNWDWLPQSRATVVVLRAHQEHAPDYITVVEAGLLAKFGLNSSGLSVLTNALVSSEDAGAPGVPYHVMLRALLDCSSASEALGRIHQADRSSSANYLIAHRDGLAFDVEARPGGFSKTHYHDPDARGVLLHTNHFLHPHFDAADVGAQLMTDTRLRLQRVRRLVNSNDSLDLASFEAALTDHVGYPDSICCHPNPADHDLEQGLTVTSAVMDVRAGRIAITRGPACGGFEPVETGFRQSKVSPSLSVK